MKILNHFQFSLETIGRHKLFSIMLAVFVVSVSAMVISILSTFKTVVVDDLPYSQAGSSVNIQPTIRVNNNIYPSGISWHEYEQLMTDTVYQKSLVIFVNDHVRLSLNGVSKKQSAFYVSKNYFDAFYNQSETKKTLAFGSLANDEVIVSQRMFDSLPTASRRLGASLEINNKHYLIIGIIPNDHVIPAFSSSEFPELWLSAKEHVNHQTDGYRYQPIAILNDMQLLDRYQNYLDGQLTSLRDGEKEISFAGVHILPLKEYMIRDNQSIAWLLALVGMIIYIIAFTNLSNLIFIKTLHRSNEFAIRLTQGASFTDLFTLNLIHLSLLILPVLSIYSMTSYLFDLNILSPLLQELLNVNASKVDIVIVALYFFTVCLSILVITLIQTLKIRSMPLFGTLKMSSGVSNSNKKTNIQENILLVIQCIISIIVLSTAIVVIGNIQSLREVDVGFKTTGLTIGAYQMNENNGSSSMINKVVSDIEASMPGTNIGMINNAPMSGKVSKVAISPEGYAEPYFISNWRTVNHKLLPLLNIPVIEGRTFNLQDIEQKNKVIVINQTFAKQVWGSESAVGKFVTQLADNSSLRVIGVVSDIHHVAIGHNEDASIYIPYTIDPPREFSIIVESDLELAKISDMLYKNSARTNNQIFVNSVTTYDAIISNALSSYYLLAKLLLVGSLISIILSSLGIIVTISTSMARRQHEICLRGLLGGKSLSILFTVSKLSLLSILFGTSVGAYLSWVLIKVLQSNIYELRVGSIFTFFVSFIILLLLSGVIALLTGYKGVKANPAELMRV